MVTNGALPRRLALGLVVLLVVLGLPLTSASAQGSSGDSGDVPAASDIAPTGAPGTEAPVADEGSTAPVADGGSAAPVDPVVEAKAASGEVRVIALTEVPGDQVVDDVRSALAETSTAASTIDQVSAGSASHVVATVDAEGLEALAQVPGVERIVEDGVNRVSDLTWPTTIGLPAVQDAGWDGSGTTIAVLDTGVQADHPYLSGRVVAEGCFSSSGTGVESLCPGGSTDPVIAPGAATPCVGVTGCPHGTHVAGIAAGGPVSSPQALTGVANDASIIAVKVFSKGTSPVTCGGAAPCLLAYDSDIIRALEWLAAEKQGTTPAFTSLAAVNLSLAGRLSTNDCDLSNGLTPSINVLMGLGVPTVAATGNDGRIGSIASPACISTTVSVGATNGAGSLASYSNANAGTDLLAPGSAITSSVPGSTYGALSGTSMATPMVAGALAALREQSPSASLASLVSRLKATGTPTSSAAGTLPEIQLDSALLGVPGDTVGLSATPGFGRVAVAWAGPAPAGDAPVEGYTVTASPGGATCSVGGAGRGCTVAGLTNGTTYTFRVTARNSLGTGAGSTVSAAPKALAPGSPFGTLDVVSAGLGTVSVAGWAIDPDTAASIQVHVYVDGTGYALNADRSRPDVDAAFGYGAAHGYERTVSAGPGARNVCAYAINVGAGSNTLLGCRTVTVPGGSPIGTIDVVSAGVGTVSVAGWAIDPDTSASIQVHVYVDGVGYALDADRSRPDVGWAFPGYGSAHGYDRTVSAGPGARNVCAYAINVGVGSNVALGCRTVTVPGGSPIGALDVAGRNPNGSITVSGWSIDPDTAAAIQVHVYFVGPSYPLTGIPLIASGSRPDVGQAFPGYGSGHGYSMTSAPLPSGITLCAYGINVGVGSTTVLGCAFVP